MEKVGCCCKCLEKLVNYSSGILNLAYTGCNVHCNFILDTLQCIAEMLRITKQAVGLDLLVVEKKLERLAVITISTLHFSLIWGWVL